MLWIDYDWPADKKNDIDEHRAYLTVLTILFVDVL